MESAICWKRLIEEDCFNTSIIDSKIYHYILKNGNNIRFDTEIDDFKGVKKKLLTDFFPQIYKDSFLIQLLIKRNNYQWLKLKHYLLLYLFLDV